MHYAKFKNSDRLRRVYDLLLLGPHTTRQIVQEANVCAVNSIIAELKANGYPIRCKCLRRGVFEYSLLEGQIEFNLEGVE